MGIALGFVDGRCEGVHVGPLLGLFGAAMDGKEIGFKVGLVEGKRVGRKHGARLLAAGNGGVCEGTKLGIVEGRFVMSREG